MHSPPNASEGPALEQGEPQKSTSVMSTPDFADLLLARQARRIQQIYFFCWERSCVLAALAFGGPAR
jgi:hypothetical protein